MIDDNTLRQLLAELLANGPLPEDRLVADVTAWLGERGERPARGKVLQQLRNLPDLTEVAGGVTLISVLLDGTTWTAFVDADDAAGATGDGTNAEGLPHEIEGGWIRASTYLSPMSWWLLSDTVPLVNADGSEIGTLRTEGLWLDDADADVVCCGPGWLDHVAGGWATLTIRAGTVSIAACAEPPTATSAQIAAVRTAFDVVVSRDRRDDVWDESPPDRRFIGVSELTQEAIWTDRQAFVAGPIPPLPALVEAAGFEAADGLVAASGFDWDEFRLWQRVNRLKITYRLESGQARRVIDVVPIISSVIATESTPDEVEAGRIAELLDEAHVSVAALDELFRDGSTPRSVRAVVDAVAAQCALRGERTPSGVVWAQSTLALTAGDATTAARLIDEAVAAGTNDFMVLVEAAEFAADRGDATAALSLLLRAGIEPYDGDRSDRWSPAPTKAQRLLDEVSEYARPPRKREVGRNDPCPCGSGRKYKACHQRQSGHALSDRSPWLYEKALRYVQTSLPDEIDDVAELLASGTFQARLALRDSPVVADMVMALDGGWDEFLDERGPLLPDDELMLAGQWGMLAPSVYEVIDVSRSRHAGDFGRLILRDIASGDRLRIESVQLGERIQPGVVLFGRPLPVDDSYRAFSGFFPVSRARVNDLIDAIAGNDIFAVAEVLAAEFRPPVLQNSDGEDMELHRIEWELDVSREQLAAALAGQGVSVDDDADWNLLGDAGQGPNTVIATFRVRTDPRSGTVSLTAEANSVGRAERTIALVAAAVAGAEPSSHEVTPIDEALDAYRESGANDGEREPLPPEAQAAIAEMMARYEQRWVDEHIPALGGRTPRQAVQDPIGREEVLQLLASFPEPDDAGPDGFTSMSPDRIRALLGL